MVPLHHSISTWLLIISHFGLRSGVFCIQVDPGGHIGKVIILALVGCLPGSNPDYFVGWFLPEFEFHLFGMQAADVLVHTVNKTNTIQNG